MVEKAFLLCDFYKSRAITFNEDKLWLGKNFTITLNTDKAGRTKFTVYRHKDFNFNFNLHAGGRSFFIFQTSREYWKAMFES